MSALESGVRVDRIAAKSGNRDNDYFRASCSCGWKGSPHSNRTAEGRRLAHRDAEQHRCHERQKPEGRTTRGGHRAGGGGREACRDVGPRLLRPSPRARPPQTRPSSGWSRSTPIATAPAAHLSLGARPGLLEVHSNGRLPHRVHHHRRPGGRVHVHAGQELRGAVVTALAEYQSEAYLELILNLISKFDDGWAGIANIRAGDVTFVPTDDEGNGFSQVQVVTPDGRRFRIEVEFVGGEPS